MSDDAKSARDAALAAYLTEVGQSMYDYHVKLCFKAGWDAAIANDPRVLALVEALEKIADANPCGSLSESAIIARDALAAFRGRE